MRMRVGMGVYAFKKGINFGQLGLDTVHAHRRKAVIMPIGSHEGGIHRAPCEAM
ncbi:hypothetical protein [Loktanella salsilacus]|uniref:hypothetical protein n=1 Tax=Loktanella salsilacus TaxID=195913 RepID=UPI0030029FEE